MFTPNMPKLLQVKQKEVTKRPLSWDKEEQKRRRLIAFVKSIQVSGRGISNGIVDSFNEFIINVDTFDYENLTFEITRVSTKESIHLDHEMIELDNRIKIVYKVAEPGQYILDIRYQDLHVPCSPFKIQIKKPKVVNPKDVIAFGKGLSRCMTGKINQFSLDMRKSGQGKISVTSRTENNNKDEVPFYIITESKHGYQVQYIVENASPFFFHIKLNGKHIRGSPFLVTASSTEEGIVKKAKTILRIQARKNQKRLL